MAEDFYVDGLARHFGRDGIITLKLVNDEGEELSMAFDDSSGSLPHLSRVFLMRFKGSKTLGEDRTLYSAEDAVRALANHIGYDLVPSSRRKSLSG